MLPICGPLYRLGCAELSVIGPVRVHWLQRDVIVQDGLLSCAVFLAFSGQEHRLGAFRSPVRLVIDTVGAFLMASRRQTHCKQVIQTLPRKNLQKVVVCQRSWFSCKLISARAMTQCEPLVQFACHGTVVASCQPKRNASR